MSGSGRLNLSQPLVALLMKSYHLRPVILGAREISIRSGHRDYRLGQIVMLVCCEDEPWAVMADIIDVRHCFLYEVSESEIKAHNSESFEDLLTELREYYPDLQSDSKVTVVRWAKVRGKLVNDFWRNAFVRGIGPVDSVLE